LVWKYKDDKFGEADTKTLLDLDTKELNKENKKFKTRLGEKVLEAILRDLIKKKNPHLLKKLK
jgi:transposase